MTYILHAILRASTNCFSLLSVDGGDKFIEQLFLFVD